MNVRRVIVASVLSLLFIVPGTAQRTRAKRPSVKSLTPAEIARKTLAALVSITTLLPDLKTPLAYGSGFCIGPDPLIPGNILVLTNYHVLKGSTAAVVRPVPSRDGDESDDVYVRCVSRGYDIALLSVSTGMKRSALSLASAWPVTGDPVYVMGNPERLEGSFSSGLVSAVRGGPVPRIQISAPISTGSSGGPVLNSLGQVIGIATSGRTDGQNLNFAIAFTLIKDLLAGCNEDPDSSWANAMTTINEDKLSNWLLVGHIEGISTYYDPDSIKTLRNGQRTMWVLAKVKQPDHEDTFMNLILFDCVNQRQRNLRFYRPGERVHELSDEWEQPKTRSFMDIACK